MAGPMPTTRHEFIVERNRRIRAALAEFGASDFRVVSDFEEDAKQICVKCWTVFPEGCDGPCPICNP